MIGCAAIRKVRQDIVWQRSNIQDYLSTGPNVDNYNQVIWSYVLYALPGGQAPPPGPPTPAEA